MRFTSTHQTELMLYGGLNTKNPPFAVGDVLKQIWRINDNGELIKDGREIVEFVGMKGNSMLLKTLNSCAAHSDDTIDPRIINTAKKSGYEPVIGQVTILHYICADRYEILNNPHHKKVKECG
jgi:hypothetical protein